MQEVINAVVIDDKLDDIIGIASALAEIGISTLPVHYNDPTAAQELCTKVAKALPRVIITDIQLRDGGADPTQADLSAVAACLANIVEKTSGPYVILAWTSKPEALERLEALVEAYFKKVGIRLPMYFDRISKDDCRTAETGYSADEILKRFVAHLAAQTSMRALMHWESSVFKAAIESVNTLADLDATTLPKNLKSLAECVAGNNLTGFEASAINEAFSYVLKDKLALLSLKNESQSVWESALSTATGHVTDKTKHRLNTTLHLEIPAHDNIICPGDVWVSSKPKLLFRRLGLVKEGISQVDRFKDEFVTLISKGQSLKSKLAEEDDPAKKAKLQDDFEEKYAKPLQSVKNACNIVMVEISPACDFANRKKALKTVALGVLLPIDSIDKGVELRKSDSTQIVKIVLDGTSYFLGFSAKYVTAFSEKLIVSSKLGLTKKLRIREGLLQSWIHSFSSYNSRIGTVSFH